MTSTRKDIFAFFGLLGLICFFYPELLFVISAPLTGDHLEQHYPWAFLLAQSIKAFHLPIWTNLIHGGFPIAAEGQIGIYYFPNLVLYFFLPFKMAYSYMNLFHWLLAGWGTYLYAKQIKLNSLSAFVAAIIFVFGAAYGGAFYNITSLKTVAWFPLALWLLERYFSGARLYTLLALALIVSQSLIAGYLQVAILTWMIFAIYTTLRILVFFDHPISWSKRGVIYGALLVTAVLALVFAAPQIYLTFQLAMQSNRTNLTEAYAYIGSLSPLALGTFINPYFSLVLRGNNLYAGLLPLFFVLTLLFSTDIRRNQVFRLWVVMILISLFLALGRWSPLYVLIIKLTDFYSFRVPAKFLVFICFGIAILSAMGFQQLWNGALSQNIIKKAAKCFFWIVGAFLSLMLVFYLMLTAGRHLLLQLGEYYVRNFFYGKPGHPHSLETYLEGVRAYPDSLVKYFSWQNPQNLWFVAIVILTGILVYLFSKQKNLKPLLVLGLIVTVTDLYALSHIDIRLDFAAYNSVLKSSPIISKIESEKAQGRLTKIYGLRSLGERLPIVPSQNMLYGLSDIGAYSPFVLSRYYQSIGLLGNVNDSNFQSSPSTEYALERLPLLNFLNVSHILSSKTLTFPSLKLIAQGEPYNSYLYANTSEHKSAYFITKLDLYDSWEGLQIKLMAPGFDPSKLLLLEKNELGTIVYPEENENGALLVSIQTVKQFDDYQEWEIEANQAGFFVVPETYFKGWQAQIDGKGVPILKAYGLFRAIWLNDSGKHRIQFRYRPFEIKGS